MARLQICRSDKNTGLCIFKADDNPLVDLQDFEIRIDFGQTTLGKVDSRGSISNKRTPGKGLRSSDLKPTTSGESDKVVSRLDEEPITSSNLLLRQIHSFYKTFRDLPI